MITFIFAVIFLLNSMGQGFAQALNVLSLPRPGTMISLSKAVSPALLKGIKVYPDNPMRFDFVLDPGSTKEVNKGHASQLIKYFLASLAVPEKDLWVNLSPYEKDRIIPENFGQTQMGRDLLAEDYILKQLASSLFYPEGETGKKFWKRVYEQAASKFDAARVQVNTIDKVWIVPERAVVYENPKTMTAYIVESQLKVMTENDYVALNKSNERAALPQTSIDKKQNPHSERLTEVPLKENGPAHIISRMIKEIMIPELTKEVNEGAQFAQLRQIYHSFILAAWYKKKIKDSILSKAFVGRNKIDGVNVADPQEKMKIYERYLEAFKKGAYNYIKEEQDALTGRMVPRKYFAGGLRLSDAAMVETHKLPDRLPAGVEVSVTFPPIKPDGLGRFEHYSSKGSRSYQEDGVVDVTIDLDAALNQQQEQLRAKGIDKNALLAAVGVSKMRVLAVMDSHSNGDQKGEDLIQRIKAQLAQRIVTSIIDKGGDVKQSLKSTFLQFMASERNSRAATTLSMVWITDKVHWGVLGDSPIMIMKKDKTAFVAPIHTLADLYSDLYKRITTDIGRRNARDQAWLITTLGLFYWPDRMQDTIHKISALGLDGADMITRLMKAELVDAKGYIKGRGVQDVEKLIRDLDVIEDNIRKIDREHGEQILTILRANRRVSLGVPAVIGAKDFVGLTAREPFVGEESLANVAAIGIGSDGVLSPDGRSLDYIEAMMRDNKSAADIVDEALNKHAHTPGGADNVTWAIWHADAAMTPAVAGVISVEPFDIFKRGFVPQRPETMSKLIRFAAHKDPTILFSSAKNLSSADWDAFFSNFGADIDDAFALSNAPVGDKLDAFALEISQRLNGVMLRESLEQWQEFKRFLLRVLEYYNRPQQPLNDGVISDQEKFWLARMDHRITQRLLMANATPVTLKRRILSYMMTQFRMAPRSLDQLARGFQWFQEHYRTMVSFSDENMMAFYMGHYIQRASARNFNLSVEIKLKDGRKILYSDKGLKLFDPSGQGMPLDRRNIDPEILRSLNLESIDYLLEALDQRFLPIHYLRKFGKPINLRINYDLGEQNHAGMVDAHYLPALIPEESGINISIVGHVTREMFERRFRTTLFHEIGHAIVMSPAANGEQLLRMDEYRKIVELFNFKRFKLPVNGRAPELDTRINSLEDILDPNYFWAVEDGGKYYVIYSKEYSNPNINGFHNYGFNIVQDNSAHTHFFLTPDEAPAYMVSETKEAMVGIIGSDKYGALLGILSQHLLRSSGIVARSPKQSIGIYEVYEPQGEKGMKIKYMPSNVKAVFDTLEEAYAQADAATISLGHGKEFLSQAVQFLQTQQVNPLYGRNFLLMPGNPSYDTFLSFLIAELGQLPLNNEVGRAYLMRRDAGAVITQLKDFIAKHQADMLAGKPWVDRTSELVNVFQGHLEVFKNEIYAGHGISGIGYSLDLGANYNPRTRAMVPFELILERRWVSPENGTISVVDNGFIKFNLINGQIQLDLDEGSTGNVHYGDTDKAAISKNTGGIDLNANKDALQIKQDDQGGIHFYADAAMLEVIENAPGLDLNIISMKHMDNLRAFLGAS